MLIQVSRRKFLQSAAMFSAIGLAPSFLTRAAHGQTAPIQGFPDGRILVVVQLGGGNDGLNTLVPFGDDAYYRARPNIGLKKERLLPLDGHVALNAKLEGMMRLHDAGKLAVIQGVGYPNPDRSHFRSMEIWQTASESDEFLGHGWIGRYFDNCCSGTARPQAGVAIGAERPQAFESEKGVGIAFQDPSRFGWLEGPGFDTEPNFQRLNSPAAPDDTIDFLRNTTSQAIMSSAEVREAAAAAKVKPDPKNPLPMVAGLIRAGLATRIYYVPFGGFDTHANQTGQHDNLLGGVGNALAKFQEQLEADGTADRVVTMVFSEFGRRVAENASGGTDHGTAAPMFLVGKGIKPGLHGAYPSLTDLDGGDLKHSTDFRNVYAGILRDWFQVDPKLVLNHPADPLALLA